MSNSEEREALTSGMKALGLSAGDVSITSMLEYLDILEETNKSFNLTRIPRTDYVSLHLLDSLTCLQVIPDNLQGQILDVGTGAGFPGVPLAAMFPASRVTVLDSTAKKVRFVAETAAQVGITNLVGVHGRAEALARTREYREAFNIVVSRAVAALPKLVELLIPLTTVGGMIVAMKGPGYEEELIAAQDLIPKLGGTVEKVHEVELPATDIRRYIIVIRKSSATPAAFPRKTL